MNEEIKKRILFVLKEGKTQFDRMREIIKLYKDIDNAPKEIADEFLFLADQLQNMGQCHQKHVHSRNDPTCSLRVSESDYYHYHSMYAVSPTIVGDKQLEYSVDIWHTIMSVDEGWKQLVGGVDFETF